MVKIPEERNENFRMKVVSVHRMKIVSVHRLRWNSDFGPKTKTRPNFHSIYHYNTRLFGQDEQHIMMPNIFLNLTVKKISVRRKVLAAMLLSIQQFFFVKLLFGISLFSRRKTSVIKERNFLFPDLNISNSAVL